MVLPDSKLLKFTPYISDGWKKILSAEFEADYFKGITSFLDDAYSAGKVVYPPMEKIFNAYNQTSYDQLKEVIIGQDPYHRPGQAQGLCFSVPEGIKRPPSLLNIFKELQSDLGIAISLQGDLTPWAKQGVFLLNTYLTVEEGQPLSHKTIGWEKFTMQTLAKINEKDFPVIFMLWGNEAKSLASLIDHRKHYILTASHPAAETHGLNRGFFGCKHFSKANEILKSLGAKPIDWKLP
jgi:uracil-DNA glycosylase